MVKDFSLAAGWRNKPGWVPFTFNCPPLYTHTGLPVLSVPLFQYVPAALLTFCISSIFLQRQLIHTAHDFPTPIPFSQQQVIRVGRKLVVNSVDCRNYLRATWYQMTLQNNQVLLQACTKRWQISASVKSEHPSLFLCRSWTNVSRQQVWSESRLSTSWSIAYSGILKNGYKHKSVKCWNGSTEGSLCVGNNEIWLNSNSTFHINVVIHQTLTFDLSTEGFIQEIIFISVAEKVSDSFSSPIFPQSKIFDEYAASKQQCSLHTILYIMMK